MKKRIIGLALAIALALGASPAFAHTQGELGPPSSHTNRCEGWFGVDHGYHNDGGNWYHTLTRTLYNAYTQDYDVIQNHYRASINPYTGFKTYAWFHGNRSMCKAGPG